MFLDFGRGVKWLNSSEAHHETPSFRPKIHSTNAQTSTRLEHPNNRNNSKSKDVSDVKLLRTNFKSLMLLPDSCFVRLSDVTTQSEPML